MKSEGKRRKNISALLIGNRRLNTYIFSGTLKFEKRCSACSQDVKDVQTDKEHERNILRHANTRSETATSSHDCKQDLAVNACSTASGSMMSYNFLADVLS